LSPNPTLLAVAGKDLLAGVTDLLSVRLQAAQNAEHVLRIDLKLGLAELGHVGLAGGAFLWVPFTHPHRPFYWRRLRRQLLGMNGCASDKRQSDRQD
jgi:hypothetical protein